MVKVVLRNIKAHTLVSLGVTVTAWNNRLGTSVVFVRTQFALLLVIVQSASITMNASKQSTYM